MWLLTNLCQAADSRLVCIDTWDGAEQYSKADCQARLTAMQPGTLGAAMNKVLMNTL